MPIVRLDNLTQFAAVNLNSDPGHIRGKKQIDSCAEITVRWGLDTGIQAHNVLHARYSGGFAGTVAQCNGILTGLTTSAQWTALAAFIHPSIALNQVSIRDLNTVDQPLIESNVSGAAGSATGTALPDEVSLVVTLRTPFSGRANRGRMYVPGWSTVALGTVNTASSGAVTALNNWASTIAGVLTANGNYLWSIGHVARAEYTSANGTHHDARPSGTVPIQTAIVRDNHWDTQRRRGLK